MKRNELVTRTGLGRGLLLSGSGQNITDDPDGASNAQVGTFALDFSCLWSGFEEFADGTFEANIVALDNEYTAVLADSRGMDGDSLDDDNDLLSDMTNPEEEDGAFVSDDVQWARIERITADWRFIGPDFQDAAVWTVSEDNGEIETALGSLGTVLDTIQAQVQELDGDVDVWSKWRSHLRWTLHWAVLVIDCTSVNDQGLADFAEDNSTLSFRNNPVPVGGPSGLLITHGSASDGTTGVRLWMPVEGEGVRVVARGEKELKYHYRLQTTDADPAAIVDFDLLMPEEGVETPYRMEDASTRVEGNNVHFRLNLERKITLKDDQMVVLMVQTGRARLARFQPPDALPVTDLIIAGPTLLDGRNGPLLRMYHHYTQVAGTVR